MHAALGKPDENDETMALLSTGPPVQWPVVVALLLFICGMGCFAGTSAFFLQMQVCLLGDGSRCPRSRSSSSISFDLRLGYEFWWYKDSSCN